MFYRLAVASNLGFNYGVTTLRTNVESHQLRLIELAKQSLPNAQHAAAEGHRLAQDLSIGRSRFLDEHGFTSELDYKRACMRDGRIMYHAHIGMNDADSTVAALQMIDAVAQTQGFRIDRAGVALDRRMGVPPELRDSLPAETGPLMQSSDDWNRLAQCASIQPHLGDFMIGQPASVINTVEALRSGCTTVGNLSQYFTFEAPGWHDAETTSAASVSAIALLGALREHGTMLHSYLEDGFGALFRCCTTVGGWAYMERYIVEDILDTKLSHCIGGLTCDPVKRAGWVFALDKIHQGESVGSMIYGDTISFGPDFTRNRGVIAEYLLWDILAQMRCPTGHAVLPLPVTEAIRIPSAEEIAEAQCFGRRIEESARNLLPHVDFNAADTFAETVCEQGKRVFNNAIVGLRDSGVDVRNPLQMLFVLKKLGPVGFESLFASMDDVIIPTDMFALSSNLVEDHRATFLDPSNQARVSGRRFLLASTDVHAHAIGALAELLSDAGANVINLGAEQNPDQIVDAAIRESVDAILISTHNGMALEYGQQLKHLMTARDCTLPVIFGGVLNQKVDDNALPVPVENDILALGFTPVTSLPQLTESLPSNNVLIGKTPNSR
ncbi:MAG: cobalamin-dependent protein [Pseudomonadota bacterium]